MNIEFTTEEADFQFSEKAVMECLENRKSSHNIQELKTLIKVLFNQPEKAILSTAEHSHFGFVALDLINAGQGSTFCKNCGKRYRSNQLEAFTVGPDDATFQDDKAKKGKLKSLFRKNLKPPGMYGGKGYRCPRGHMLIYMQTWTT